MPRAVTGPLGAREIGTGIGLLISANPSPRLWGRAARWTPIARAARLGEQAPEEPEVERRITIGVSAPGLLRLLREPDTLPRIVPPCNLSKRPPPSLKRLAERQPAARSDTP